MVENEKVKLPKYKGKKGYERVKERLI